MRCEVFIFMRWGIEYVELTSWSRERERERERKKERKKDRDTETYVSTLLDPEFERSGVAVFGRQLHLR